MHFTTERLERLQRSLELALNQEWPHLSATQKRLAKLRPTPIPVRAVDAKPLTVVATVATDGGENKLGLEPIQLQGFPGDYSIACLGVVGGTWTRCRKAIPFGLGLWLLAATTLTACASTVDDVVAAEMKAHHILGVSLAIIDNGDISTAKGYGFTDQSGTTPVTTSTLFLAGSVSKPVAALGALRLVEDGRLSLDEDVNRRLKEWKMPENEFTKHEKVTLRRILSHSAGLRVHGFPGYAVGKPVPTLMQVLDGATPANTAAIRVDTVPGSTSRYSGGGYTVMQQIMIDVTGQPFPEFMQEAVLTPLRMAASSYDQPLPKERVTAAATGYYANGKQVEGKWHIYPEMAAAGLWTTASDLARFAIGIQQALAGKSNPVISQSMTRQMLTAQKGDSGLGFGLRGSGKTLRFVHGGRDEGFDSFLMAYAESEQGVVIMINANDDSGAVNRILRAVSREYHWPEPELTRGVASGSKLTTLLIVYVASGVLLILLSLPLLWGKVPPNGLYGFRVRATLEDPAIWYAANRYAANRLLWSGEVFVVAAVGLYFIPGISVDVYSFGCLFVFAVPLVIGLIQSLRYVKALARQTR